MDNRQYILDKLAYLITHDKASVVAILKANHITLHNQLEKTIANAIIDNIYTNKGLQVGLDNLLKQNKEKFSNDTGDTDLANQMQAESDSQDAQQEAQDEAQAETTQASQDTGAISPETTTGGTGSTITTIAGLATSILGIATSAQAAKIQQEKDSSALTKSVMDYKTAQVKAPVTAGTSYTIYYVIGAVVVVGILALVALTSGKKTNQVSTTQTQTNS